MKKKPSSTGMRRRTSPASTPVSYTHLDVYKRQLQTEYDGLKATHTELAGQLATVKEELQPMKDIRYWIGKVLTPEQAEVEKKPEPKHSLTEKMKFLQEQDKKQPEQKSPQHKQKKQNMEL